MISDGLPEPNLIEGDGDCTSWADKITHAQAGKTNYSCTSWADKSVTHATAAVSRHVHNDPTGQSGGEMSTNSVRLTACTG